MPITLYLYKNKHWAKLDPGAVCSLKTSELHICERVNFTIYPLYLTEQTKKKKKKRVGGKQKKIHFGKKWWFVQLI